MADKELKNIPDHLDILCESGAIHIKKDVPVEGAADGADDNGDARPTFEMVAYTGGKMDVPFWEHPVVIDLSGLDIESQTRPIRFQHSAHAGIGHSTKIEVVKNQLLAEGVISRATPEAEEVISSSRFGFPWQASVGVVAKEVEFMDDQTKTTVNGKSQKGPMFVLRTSVLGEISFVDLGADDRTSVSVQAEFLTKEGDMPKKDEKKGDQVPVSQDAPKNEDAPVIEAAAPKTVETPKTATPKADPVKDVPVVEAAADTTIADGRISQAKEVRRMTAINKMCEGHPEVHAQAIEGGWDADRAELELLRTSRPKVAPVTTTPADAGNVGNVLECAAMVAGKYPGVEKMFDDQTLQTAHTQYRSNIGLQELLMEAAAANGWTGRRFDHREVLQFAFNGVAVNAAFSSVSIAGILSNIANKFLLKGWDSVEQVWRQVSAQRPVKDFKQVSSYRLIGTEQYEKVGPGGEIKHGDLGNQTFTNQADTYGLMLAVSRQDIINDDLGALTNIPRKLGRGSGLKINDVFWTEFLDNSSHFATGNSNYMEGSTTNLAIAGLTAGELIFMDQTDTEGKPLGLMPEILLVPTAISAEAAVLMRSAEVRQASTSLRIPVGNPHQGKFTPVVSRYLGNSNFTGYSITAWYLLANPADLPTIEVAFLNGQESPTIEQADANFNTLGIQMRGFHDFGVNLQDPKGGFKSKGAA